MRRGIVTSMSMLVLVGLALCSSDVQAQHRSRPAVRRYNGIDAGRDAYLIHENQRRGAITAQMALNDDMLMLRGLPPKYFEYFPANPLDANPFDALSPGPAVDAVWSTPYYPADPLVTGVPESLGAIDFEADDWGAIDDTAAEVDRLFERPVAPTPNPPRPANAGGRPALNRPAVRRVGQPLRPERLPAPAEVREQQRGGPREF